MNPVTPFALTAVQVNVVPLIDEFIASKWVAAPLQTTCPDGVLATKGIGFTVTFILELAGGQDPKVEFALNVAVAIPEPIVGVKIVINESGWLKFPDAELQITEAPLPEILPLRTSESPPHIVTGEPALTE